MKQLAVEEVEKIERAQQPKPGKMKKSNPVPLSSSGGAGGGMEAQLTAFEDVRWFVLANDADGKGLGLNDEAEAADPKGKQSASLVRYICISSK
jgi:hypothetical protein